MFCKLVAKEIPSHSFYEDEHALAFLDINPRAPGHAMVIPKVHAAALLDLPEAEVGPLFGAVKVAMARIAEVLKPDAFTIGVNQGEAAGQTVKHLHVHIIPRWKGDGGGSIHSVVHNLPAEDVAAIAARLRQG